MKRFGIFILSFIGALLVCSSAQNAGDPNEGSRLTQTSTPNFYRFAWWGIAGRTYFILQSDDLFTWSYVPVIESGTDDVIVWGFTSTAGRFFVRLKYTDTPTSDPGAADFDSDTLSNIWELRVGFDPFVANDPNGDADGDGRSNYVESQSNTNASKKAPVMTLTAPVGATLN